MTSSLPDAVGVVDTVAWVDETGLSDAVVTVPVAAVDVDGTGLRPETDLVEAAAFALFEPVMPTGGRGVVLADRAGLADDVPEAL